MRKNCPHCGESFYVASSLKKAPPLVERDKRARPLKNQIIYLFIEMGFSPLKISQSLDISKHYVYEVIKEYRDHIKEAVGR